MQERSVGIVLVRPERHVLVQATVTLGRFARRKPLGAAGIAIIVLAVAAALLGPSLAPYDPWEMHRLDRFQSPSMSYLLGTDNLGRDIFSRTLYGTRVSLYVGLITMIISAAGGLALGVGTAYIGGKFDLIIQRFVDTVIATPTLILALALIAALGPSINNVILAIAIVQTPRITRVIRSAALSIKQTPYIDSARAMGGTNLRIMLRHVAPNTFGPLLIVATSAIGSIIITESTLSFLGLGVDAETITWGVLLSGDTRQYISGAPWMALGPGFAITLVVFGVNMLGDALRDVLDPKLRGR